MIHYNLDRLGFNASSVVTVGTFDGIHVAHRKIFEALVEKGKLPGARSILITFKPHPQEIVGKKKVELLMTEEERVERAGDLGIDEICLLKFDRDLSLISAEDFLIKYIRDRIGLSELVLGFNHRFGRNAEGTVAFAREIGRKIGFKVEAVDTVTVEGKTVSSSNIRHLLRAGDISLANKMLGRSFSVEGFVISGDRRGRLLGYPTANLRFVDERILIPAFGVYVVEVSVDKEKFAGLASVGVRPTFENEGTPLVEAWISDFDRDIYGKRIRVSFVDRLRGEIKFESAEQLIAQMDVDRRMLNEYLVKTYNKQS